MSVYRGQGTPFTGFRYVFKPHRPEMCGETIAWCLYSSVAQQGRSTPIEYGRNASLPLGWDLAETAKQFALGWSEYTTRNSLSKLALLLPSEQKFPKKKLKKYQVYRKKGKTRGKTKKVEANTNTCLRSGRADGAKHGWAYPHADRLPSKQEPSRQEGGNL